MVTFQKYSTQDFFSECKNANKAMRILLNTIPLLFAHKTGIAYYIFNLYRGLLDSGVEVIPTVDTESGKLVSSLARLSSRLRTRMGRWYPSQVKTAGTALIRLFSKKDSGSLHYDLYHEASLFPMPEIRTRSVCNLYDLSFIRFPDFFLEDFVREVTVNVKKNVSKAEKIIVNTQFIKNEAMNILGLPDDKIDVIPLASSARYYRMPHRPAVLPGMVKRFTEKDYLLCVGTIEPRKNLKTLMRAFRIVKDRYDLSLVISGTPGWLYEDILSYPRELGLQQDVVFTHYVDEETLLLLYNYATAAVYPSFYEGFGLPPLEAMSCGTPVIISNIPSLSEVGGDAVMSFSPSDHEELAYIIEKVLSSKSLQEEMIRKGLQKSKEYSWQRVTAETIQTYTRALGT